MRNRGRGVGGLTSFCFSRAQARETIKTWLRHPASIWPKDLNVRCKSRDPWPGGFELRSGAKGLGSCSRCSVIVRAAEKEPATRAAQLAAYLLQFRRTVRANAHDARFGLGCRPRPMSREPGRTFPRLILVCLVHDFRFLLILTHLCSAMYLAIRFFISSGDTSSLWVATVHMCPKGS